MRLEMIGGYLPIIEKNAGGSLWEEGALKRVNGSTEAR